jgi:hypothetical protein
VSSFIGDTNLFAVLFVGDLFEPVAIFSVEHFLNGDVRHGGGR